MGVRAAVVLASLWIGPAASIADGKLVPPPPKRLIPPPPPPVPPRGGCTLGRSPSTPSHPILGPSRNLKSPWRQPRGKTIVSLVNSHTNATSKR